MVVVGICYRGISRTGHGQYFHRSDMQGVDREDRMEYRSNHAVNLCLVLNRVLIRGENLIASICGCLHSDGHSCDGLKYRMVADGPRGRRMERSDRRIPGSGGADGGLSLATI